MTTIPTMQSPLILTGAYGSGKTECAMALAVACAALRPTTLVDLDFVTPYFRVLDHRDALASVGVPVIAPRAEIAQFDAPALPAEAGAALMYPHGQTIVDLGGDPNGAIVLGQFAPKLTAYDLWAVVNFSRPTTPDPATALLLLTEVAAATRLRITGLVSNTHLGPYTTPADIRAGLEQACALAAMLQVPVTLLCVPAGITAPDTGLPVLAITPRLKRQWE